jgi:hypothetical protein
VNDTTRARRLLMQAAGVTPGEPVGIPANTRRALSEAVKRSGARPHFVDLNADLSFDMDTPGAADLRLLWAAPPAGMPAPTVPDGMTMFVDYSFTLPAPLPRSDSGLGGAATVWGLHIQHEGAPRDDGALIAFADEQLFAAARALLTADDLPHPGRALAQCARLAGDDGLAARQLRVLDAARLGMLHGAGLPMMPEHGLTALPFGLAVRIPDEADIPTFISYVRNENVSLDWLPEIQPMFYVVNQVTADPRRTACTAAHLARWIVAPLGPDFDDDQITHAVLGILKAAEYTGVRWYTDRERATWYGNLMLEWYGASHDAYRPAFLPMGADGSYVNR